MRIPKTSKLALRVQRARLIRRILKTPEKIEGQSHEDWCARYSQYRLDLSAQTKARLEVATELFARTTSSYRDTLTEIEWLAVRHIDLELLARLGATVSAEPIIEPGSYKRSQFVATFRDLRWTTYFWSNHPAALDGYPEFSKRFNSPTR